MIRFDKYSWMLRFAPRVALAFLLLIVANTSIASASAADVNTAADVVTNSASLSSREILITVSHDSERELNLFRAMSRSSYGYGQYDSALLARKKLQEIADDYQLHAAIDAWQIETLGEYCAVFRVHGSRNFAELIQMLTADKRVASVQQMSIYQTASAPESILNGSGQRGPKSASGSSDGYSDPYFKRQYAGSAKEVERLHDRSTGRGVKIALIDTAVDLRHDDFSGLSVESRSTIPSAVEHSGDTTHGTAMLGIMAATRDNNTGIVGLAPDASVLSLAACWYPAIYSEATHSEKEGEIDNRKAKRNGAGAAICNSLSIAAALDMAIRQDANIINLSLAGPHDPLIARMVKSAIRRGKVIVASDPLVGELRYPAQLPGVLAVSAAGLSASPEQNQASFNSGQQIQGNLAINLETLELLSTAPFGSYDFFQGASVSSAFTTGLVALNFSEIIDSQKSLMLHVADDMSKFHFAYQLGQ